MRKLLWIGDAGCDSGFARATHKILDTLRHEYQVAVLGLNYLGDPHGYPYPLHPCWPGQDAFGVGRLEEMVGMYKPDVIVLLNDPWNVPYYMQYLKSTGIPVVAMLAVDGKNCRGGDVTEENDPIKRGLNDLALAIFWTEFGRREAIAGGYVGPTAVIPLGVDLNVYQPVMKEQARKKLGLPIPADAFLIGNVNRNQLRKRMDLTLTYFADFLKETKRDAYLMLHAAPTGEKCFDLRQLVRYLDISGHVIVSEPDSRKGLKESELALLYSAFDIGMSTTQGEGMGLPALEMMACGTPQVLPDWSAYGEWAADAARLVGCSSIAVTTNTINVIGGIADHDDFVSSLVALAESEALLDRYRDLGFTCAAQSKFRWENIGRAFADVLQQTLWPVTELAVG